MRCYSSDVDSHFRTRRYLFIHKFPEMERKMGVIRREVARACNENRKKSSPGLLIAGLRNAKSWVGQLKIIRSSSLGCEKEETANKKECKCAFTNVVADVRIHLSSIQSSEIASNAYDISHKDKEGSFSILQSQ